MHFVGCVKSVVLSWVTNLEYCAVGSSFSRMTVTFHSLPSLFVMTCLTSSLSIPLSKEWGESSLCQCKNLN